MKISILSRSIFFLFSVVFILSIFLFSIRAYSFSSYLDVTPISSSFGSDSSPVKLEVPDWLGQVSVGSISYPDKNFIVVGHFDNCVMSVEPDVTYATNVVSSFDNPMGSSGDLQIQILTSYTYVENIYAVPLDSSLDFSYELLHVYLCLPSFDFPISSLYYADSDYADLIPSLSFFSFSIPGTSGSAPYHWLKIPADRLSLADSVTLDFVKYTSSSVLDPSPNVAVFSGSQQIDYQLSQTESVYSISVTDLDPVFDLYIRISFPDALALSIESGSIRYGLLLSEVDFLSKINDSLNSNFKSLQELLESQHSDVIEILDSNNSWLSRIHTVISNGFSSVGSWFTSLWNNLSSSFTNIGSWIQNQTDTLGAKLDALINGTQAQQEAAQQAQQNAAALDQQLGNLSAGLQVDQPNSDDVDGSVSSFLPADSGPILANSFGSLLGSGSVLPLFMISLILTLVSFLIFGKRG